MRGSAASDHGLVEEGIESVDLGSNAKGVSPRQTAPEKMPARRSARESIGDRFSARAPLRESVDSCRDSLQASHPLPFSERRSAASDHGMAVCGIASLRGSAASDHGLVEGGIGTRGSGMLDWDPPRPSDRMTVHRSHSICGTL